MNNIDLEKLYTVTREEFGENVDAVLDKVKETSPILIRSEGEPDLLLFDYEHYMELFGFLYTEEQIAEIEAGCASCEEKCHWRFFMSSWVRIYGTICVRPMGRTQAEKSYILQTVLDHLPCVSGSEDDMRVYTQLKDGHNSSSSHDEFGRLSNLLINRYDKHSINGWLQVQDEYLLIIDADLRDRYYKETIRDFQKWL